MREALATFGIVISGTISFYVILLYMPTFARTQLQLPLDQAFSAQAISLACMIVLIPIFGALSDRIGRRPIMMGALLLYFALTYPLFSWMYGNPSFASLMITQVALCSLLGAFFGPMSTALAEQFQARVRSTGLGTAYNVAVMVFGGFAPFFVTWLIQVTGLPVAPAFYVMFGAAAGLLASLFLKERARDADLAMTDAKIVLN
jgi:MFS family permease